MRRLVAIPLLCLCGLAMAQSSPSYRLEEFRPNAGGHPQDGLTLQSTSYRISLDAVGEALASPTLRGGAFEMDAGFSHSYPPPGEVRHLLALGDKQTMTWKVERSVGTYRVYGGQIPSLPGEYGVCKVADLRLPQASLDEQPPPGGTFFYLVTARNILSEEGTTGYDGSGLPRPPPVPCP